MLEILNRLEWKTTLEVAFEDHLKAVWEESTAGERDSRC